jgi:hypothetical protein
VEGSELKEATLLEFASHWDWKGNRYKKRGSTGALSYIVNVWPQYQADPEDTETYKKYCHAKMILHHPFTKIEELLNGHSDWTTAYKEECQGHCHLHIDDTLPRINNRPHIDESDSESIPEEHDDGEDYRAEWMNEAG